MLNYIKESTFKHSEIQKFRIRCERAPLDFSLSLQSCFACEIRGLLHFRPKLLGPQSFTSDVSRSPTNLLKLGHAHIFPLKMANVGWIIGNYYQGFKCRCKDPTPMNLEAPSKI